MIINRAVTITALAGGVISLAISIVYGPVYLAALAGILFTASLALWKYGYLIIPAITKASNIVEVRGGFEVPASRDYILKKTASGYYSTRFLEIRFYESSMDKNESEKTTMFESFEKAIAALKYVVKISLLVSAIDLSKHIDEIKTKRSAAESRKAKGGLASDDTIKIDREIAKWNRMLDRITHGEKPVELLAFASTTAFGITRDEAIARSSRQAKELNTILSSSLGCDVKDLTDLDMLRCFEWEHFFPTSQEEIKDEIF